jgi:hypothetical protein
MTIIISAVCAPCEYTIGVSTGVVLSAFVLMNRAFNANKSRMAIVLAGALVSLAQLHGFSLTHCAWTRVHLCASSKKITKIIL